MWEGPAAGRLDGLLAGAVTGGAGEPGGDLVGRDVELAGVGLEPALVAGGVGVAAAGTVRWADRGGFLGGELWRAGETCGHVVAPSGRPAW